MKRPGLLLDQMMGADVAATLKTRGYDVLRVSEVGMAEADDDAVLAWTIANQRILVTLDEHFGDWVVLPLSRHPGVIRLKAEPTTSANILEILLPFLSEEGDRVFSNRLVIVTRLGVRWISTDK